MIEAVKVAGMTTGGEMIVGVMMTEDGVDATTVVVIVTESVTVVDATWEGIGMTIAEGVTTGGAADHIRVDAEAVAVADMVEIVTAKGKERERKVPANPICPMDWNLLQLAVS